MSAPNPMVAPKFYCKLFDMKIVGKTESPLASRMHISDDIISLARLKV